MGVKPEESGSLVTLPVVLGVLVVMGGITALGVSSLFVYRAYRVRVETTEMQAAFQAERERVIEPGTAGTDEPAQGVSEHADASTVPPGSERAVLHTTLDPAMKRGTRLRAQRPVHWDEAEVIDVLEDNRIKVRWLSGEPGEEVIASELVRSGERPLN